MLTIQITRNDGTLLESIDFASLASDLHEETGDTGTKLDSECFEYIRQRVLLALLSERRMREVNEAIFSR